MRGAHFLGALTVAAGLAAAAHAAPPQKAELLAKAAAGAAACAQHMPNMGALSPALGQAGLRLYDANGQLRVYTDGSNRVAVGVTAGPHNGTRAKGGCVVAVNGMSANEAAKLIQPWIKATNAQPIAAHKDSPRWLGVFKGAPIILAIDPKADLDFIDGAAIVAVSPN